MAFWENLSGTITAKSKEVADKAKNFTDIASLKGQIVAQENVILRQYKEIGRAYYAAHKDDAAAEFPEQMEAVKKAEDLIEEMKKRIAELCGTRHCPICENDVPDDSIYCPKCGTKMEEKTEEVFYDEEDASDVVVSEIVEEAVEAAEEVVEDVADFVVTEITEE